MTRTRQPNWAPWLFIAPFLLLFLTFTAYPLIKSMTLSLHQTFGPRATRFVGIDNFRFLLADPLFWKALRNTALFTAGSIFLQLPLSLGLAMLLNRPSIKGRALFRLIFFSPSLVGLVFVAMMFSLIFEKHTGLLNVALNRAVGFNVDYPWLQEHVMLALIIAALWMYVGFNMVYFLAALQNVSKELLEAAEIDGAGAVSRFFNITLPAISPVGSFVVLLSLIAGFQLFELPYILLNGGGPNSQGLTIVMYLFQTGFETSDLGYASAIGWVLALLLIVFAVLQRTFAAGREI
jgi:ABC-type sugar transport system permease subunit